jgi:hypothetical protein
MELRARIQPLPRRAAMMAACAALLVTALAAAILPANADAKKRKAPVVTKVSPLDLAVGEKLTIRGRNFVKGRKKNSVVFKRDGARAVFAKADLATKKMMVVTIPPAVGDYLRTQNGAPVPTRFRIRVLAKKLSKNYTKNKKSPLIRAVRNAPDPTVDSADCNGDGVLNGASSDDDGDLLPDDLERRILSDGCKADTDGDGVEDGFEYQSAVDLNDDEYQVPNKLVAYPHKMPYPNPGFKDATVDYDGDSLTLEQEQALWKYSYSVGMTATRTLSPLNYSDGMQHSLSTPTGPNGRRVPSQPAATYPAAEQFVAWAQATGYLTIDLRTADTFNNVPGGTVAGLYDIRDINLSGVVESGEYGFTDIDNNGYVSDAERDEDVDGLSNYEELNGRLLPAYWSGCYDEETDYPVLYKGTQYDDPDTDGDGVRDGADDQDHDDLPNLMELSRMDASGINDTDGTECKPSEAKATADLEDNGVDENGVAKPRGDGKPDVEQYGNHPFAYGRVNPFNPCLPFADSRTCSRFSQIGSKGHAPFDGSVDWWSLN